MSSFKTTIGELDRRMKLRSKPVHTATWQGIDISKRPEAEMRELTNVFFKVDLPSEELDYYRSQIKPNLPWADSHFDQERVSGIPINPGETWKDWPYGNSASTFLHNGIFDVSYAERIWPRLAQRDGSLPNQLTQVNRGIRYEYGDLNDVVNLLLRDPLTRQAYLGLWHPEDNGAIHGQRVMCSLGYHWLMRDNRLNIFYPIRSMDWLRHGRDDFYMTVRLLLWILHELRQRDSTWDRVIPGEFSCWIGSLHVFRNDYIKLYGKDLK